MYFGEEEVIEHCIEGPKNDQDTQVEPSLITTHLTQSAWGEELYRKIK